MRRSLAWLVSLAVGTGLGAGSHLVGFPDPLLSASIAASYAVAVRLALLYPDTVHEEGTAVWEVGRWSGASTAFVLAVAVVGVGWTLPIDGKLQLSLRLLVLGVGYAMWVFGVAYARAKGSQGRDDGRPDGTDGRRG